MHPKHVSHTLFRLCILNTFQRLAAKIIVYIIKRLKEECNAKNHIRLIHIIV